MSDPIPPPKPGLFAAKIAYYGLLILILGGLGLTYYALTSEGLRYSFSTLGLKVHKLLPIGALRSSTFWSKLDLAHVFSLVMLVAVCFSAKKLLAKILLPDAPTVWDSEAYTRVLTIFGIIVLGADAIFFYIALSTMTWGEVSLSFKSLLLTAAYVACLVISSLMLLEQQKKIELLEAA